MAKLSVLSLRLYEAAGALHAAARAAHEAGLPVTGDGLATMEEKTLSWRTKVGLVLSKLA